MGHIRQLSQNQTWGQRRRISALRIARYTIKCCEARSLLVLAKPGHVGVNLRAVTQLRGRT